MIRNIAITALALLMAGGAAQAQQADVQQNLDRKVNLEDKDKPISDVFAALTTQSGVKFEIAPEALALLPYGSQTRLNVMLKDKTVRSALTPLLSPVALQWAVEGQAVRITPSEPLLRMCHRATYDELVVLGKLQQAQLAPAAGKTAPADQFAAALDKLRNITGDHGLQVIFQANVDQAEAQTRAAKALPCSVTQWLDALCGPDNTWYLSGSDIIVLERVKQVERQLQRLVSIKYENAQLATVLGDLARQGHVQLTMDPGVLQALPADTRNNFNLMMNDAPIARALEVISGATGLIFTRTSDGINVEAKAPTTGQAPRPRTSWFLVMELPVDGTKAQLFLRSDDLPDDLRAAIEARKADFIKKLRAQLVKPVPAP